MRCVSQVHGAALAALRVARDHVELELNSAADSPLVSPTQARCCRTAISMSPGLALAFDTLGLALAQSAMLCVQRCQKLFTPALSGLPLQLTTHGPEHSGFATLQKTLVALYGAIRHLANPASLDGVPVSEMVEDHASMAPHAVAKAGAMAPHLRMLAAIELLAAAQAVDLRGLRHRRAGHWRSACPCRGPRARAEARRRPPAGPGRRDRLRRDRRGGLPAADLLAP